MAASDLANEVGQSSGVNVEASVSLAGPSSVPSISVSLAEHQQVEGDAPGQQEMIGKYLMVRIFIEINFQVTITLQLSIFSQISS